jgi:fermentation-respiration switch protein FrsA (DUF1100 family)
MLARKLILSAIIIVTISVPMLGDVIFWIAESHFIYHPHVFPAGNWNPKKPAPQNVQMKSVDGTPIHGWYLPQRHAQAVILYLHGNTGNVTDRYTEIVNLWKIVHASVFVLDYRGFGKSEGHPNESGIIQDAQTARDWLAHKEQISPEKIVILGRSLGTGVAVDIANHSKTKVLVLISAFLSLPDVVKQHYPFLAPSQIMHDKFDSEHKIGDYQGALLQFHSDSDELISIQQARKLFSLAKGPKYFYQLHTLKHSDPLTKEVYVAIARFIFDNQSGESSI